MKSLHRRRNHSVAAIAALACAVTVTAFTPASNATATEQHGGSKPAPKPTVVEVPGPRTSP